jgi:hypothetical protein
MESIEDRKEGEMGENNLTDSKSEQEFEFFSDVSTSGRSSIEEQEEDTDNNYMNISPSPLTPYVYQDITFQSPSTISKNNLNICFPEIQGSVPTRELFEEIKNPSPKAGRKRIFNKISNHPAPISNNPFLHNEKTHESDQIHSNYECFQNSFANAANSKHNSLNGIPNQQICPNSSSRIHEMPPRILNFNQPEQHSNEIYAPPFFGAPFLNPNLEGKMDEGIIQQTKRNKNEFDYHRENYEREIRLSKPKYHKICRHLEFTEREDVEYRSNPGVELTMHHEEEPFLFPYSEQAVNSVSVNEEMVRNLPTNPFSAFLSSRIEAQREKADAQQNRLNHKRNKHAADVGSLSYQKYSPNFKRIRIHHS